MPYFIFILVKKIMKLDEVIVELRSYGNEDTKKTFIRHGAREPFFGVKVQDLKKIVKKIKKDHDLSLELFSTGNSDAMYLAGLIADESKISKNELNDWVKGAYWYMISEYTVAWVASESKYGWELALEWIDSSQENIASSGWSTLSNMAMLYPDNELDIQKYSELLDRIENEIHKSQNRVRYTMNGFVIAVGVSVAELSEKAKKIAAKIGKVDVNMGKTACKVPLASDYIQKVAVSHQIGKKRKSARC